MVKIIVSLYALLACFSCQSQNVNKMQQGVVRNSDQKKERSKIVVKRNENIYTVTKISALSLNSIIVEVSFVNDSDSDFTLYRPILPINPRVAIFSLYDKKGYENVDLQVLPDPNIRFYSGMQKVLPVVIPEMKRDNFIILAKKSTLTFSMDIAKYYNFGEMLNKKKRHFTICYFGYFPVIHDLQHRVEMDPVDKKIKPVYYYISSKEINGEPVRTDFFIN